MFAMTSRIETYQALSALSARMVEAAQCQDWEHLIALEQKVASLRDGLIGDDDNIRLSSNERLMKTALIQRILDDDAEVRKHTEPWMEHVRRYLGDTVNKRRVEQAYGAHRL